MKESHNENIPKSCQDASLYSDKIQYEEASFWEKLKLKMHIAYCKRCRKYNNKNTTLTHLFKTHSYKTLDSKDIKDINTKLRKQLK